MDSIYSSFSSSKGKNIITGDLLNCYYCKTETTNIKIGWQLNNGELALLCETCCSAYEDGSFCSRFHKGENGWRSCELCGKMMHCGCIISLKDIVFMDFGGICCFDCGNKYLIRVVNMHLGYNLGSASLAYDPNYKLSTIYEELFEDVEKDVKVDTPSAMEENAIVNASSGREADKTEVPEKKIIVYTRKRKSGEKNNLKG